jgi:Fe-S cluster assembly protein SufB
VVELVALKGARINYATVQNWYGGDEEGRGGILNFVTKRAAVGDDAAVSWTQLEVGSAMTWKYPSCMLNGARSKGEFFSVSVTNRRQAADTGCKMIHLGEGSTSTIISRSVALGRSLNAYRGRVAIGAGGARSFTKCDSLVIGDEARAASFPTVSNGRPDSAVSHEATVGTVSDEALFHLASRGVDEDDSIGLLVNGFCGDIIKKLPAEFAMEARQLINISVEKTARGRPMMHEEANHA